MQAPIAALVQSLEPMRVAARAEEAKKKAFRLGVFALGIPLFLVSIPAANWIVSRLEPGNDLGAIATFLLGPALIGVLLFTFAKRAGNWKLPEKPAYLRAWREGVASRLLREALSTWTPAERGKLHPDEVRNSQLLTDGFVRFEAEGRLEKKGMLLGGLRLWARGKGKGTEKVAFAGVYGWAPSEKLVSTPVLLLGETYQKLGKPRLGLLRIHEAEAKVDGLFQVFLPEGEKAPKLREDWCRRLAALRRETEWDVHVAMTPEGLGVAISSLDRLPLEANIWTPNSPEILQKELQMYQVAARFLESLAG